MAQPIEIIITEDSYTFKISRSNTVSTQVLCSILRDLGIADLYCSSTDSLTKASTVAPEVHIETPTAVAGSQINSDDEGQSSQSFEKSSSISAEEIQSISPEWAEFEKGLKESSIKNEPEWCLIYSYFVLRESNLAVEKNTIRNVYKASGRYTKNRSKDFPINVKKCVERNWLTYDRYNISITEEGLKHVLEHLYCQG